MERDGKTLKTLKPGDKRRLADGRNAFRKMTPEQRDEFLDWIARGDPSSNGMDTLDTQRWEEPKK